MRLVSWNLAGRVKKLPAQIDALAERKPDLVALQEVTKTTAPLLREALAQLGLTYVADTVEGAISHNRRYAVLVAGRWPLGRRTGNELAIPWPERVLATTVAHPTGQIELYTAYIPVGSNQANSEIKLAALEGLYHALARPAKRPRILCGDFNIPQAERPDGQLITFGQTIKPNGQVITKRALNRISGARWDRAERLILTELAAFDLADTFRALNGHQTQECSWYAKNRGRQFGFRLDHVFAARALNPVRCAYLHAFRRSGLSDHAPLEVQFAIPPFHSGSQTGFENRNE